MEGGERGQGAFNTNPSINLVNFMCKKKPEVEKLRRDGVSLSKDTFSGISLAPSSFLFYWVLGLSCRLRRSLRQDEALTVKTDMKRRADLLPVSTSRSRWTTVDIMWGPSRSRASRLHFFFPVTSTRKTRWHRKDRNRRLKLHERFLRWTAWQQAKKDTGW